MSVEDFHSSLLRLTERRPFRTFTVSLADGRKFEVDRAGAIGFRGGKGAFIGSGKVFIDFTHDGVSDITESPADAQG